LYSVISTVVVCVDDEASAAQIADQLNTVKELKDKLVNKHGENEASAVLGKLFDKLAQLEEKRQKLKRGHLSKEDLEKLDLGDDELLKTDDTPSK
jgi:hypothetical protein